MAGTHRPICRNAWKNFHEQLGAGARFGSRARDAPRARESFEQPLQLLVRHRLDQILIETSRLPKLKTEDYYNFVDGKKVKRLAVNDALRDKLSRGSLAIVRYEGSYELIPRDAALKIKERDPQRIILLNEPKSQDVDPDDPYAAYQVPDDLMW